MTITIQAIYSNGVFQPERPVELADGTQVQLKVDVADPCEGSFAAVVGTCAGPSDAAKHDKSLAERIVARARALPPETLGALPDDLAAQHDHYLYGTPKRPE